MASLSEKIVEQLRKKLEAADVSPHASKVGTILEVGDGIATIAGLPDTKSSELLVFTTQNGETVYGLALNLLEDVIGAVVLGEATKLSAGDSVKGSGEVLSVPAGPGLVGRVVNPLGEPIDGKGALKGEVTNRPIERVAPGVITRQSVDTPLQTGIKAIDAMIPIGRGQRELIIGDRQTGKTAIAVDSIINQVGKGVYCIYVAIGQKESKVAKIVGELEARGAMEFTTVVVAGASDSAALSYLAPYAGCAMGEAYLDNGKDALVVYDDLSKHSVAYREISLLLKRPPGREAYPGDVFYLHSRLLERAARLNNAEGGGSLTALPIIETQAGDVSAYIPTNVISITDGQIYLESDLFYQGIRPALNVGLSVSRVGSAAQIKAMKQVAGKLRLDLAQYRELAAFAQFGSDLDEETKARIERGKRVTELLTQPQYEPMDVIDQVLVLYAAVNGYIDAVPVEKIGAWEKAFLKYMGSAHRELVEQITEAKQVGDDEGAALAKALQSFNAGFTSENA
ncbi:F0F1 ATP synthase subunit alpha [Candidatus Uhrbacteria bacterium CG10_big_fil_rev_8_21_14_0_10_48_11]|uniref:ATP synthase subunit alpha n=1 Tax=Candidatus Uhrbacteria bacterium CG10_big_fil_rev_8_21_14_0_10_48_11 TaxID=1975037 RepID=A0A2M8LF24_9BACT|nr:MAG: F0F1 ATP synthase subunit alpha [Candidatus Uhrbacteria bacterium CG10_big_fil_rev_8_21_14_0_10_48_11]